MKNLFIIFTSIFLLLSCQNSENIIQTNKINKEFNLSESDIYIKNQELIEFNNHLINNLPYKHTNTKGINFKELKKYLDALSIAGVDVVGAAKIFKYGKALMLGGLPGQIGVTTAAIFNGAICSINAYASSKAQDIFIDAIFKSKVKNIYENSKNDNLTYIDISVPNIGAYDYIYGIVSMHNTIIAKAIEKDITNNTPEGIQLSPAYNSYFKCCNYNQFISSFQPIEDVYYYENLILNSREYIEFEDSLLTEIHEICSNDKFLEYNDEYITRLLGGEEEALKYPTSVLYFYLTGIKDCENINNIIYMAKLYIEKIFREPAISEIDKETLIMAISLSVNSFAYWYNINI